MIDDDGQLLSAADPKIGAGACLNGVDGANRTEEVANGMQDRLIRFRQLDAEVDRELAPTAAVGEGALRFDECGDVPGVEIVHGCSTGKSFQRNNESHGPLTRATFLRRCPRPWR